MTQPQPEEGMLLSIPMPVIDDPVTPAVPVGPSPFLELDELDMYVLHDESVKKISAAVYPADEQGFLSLPTPSPHNVGDICEAISRKLSQGSKQWTEVVGNGVILKLVPKGKKHSNPNVPSHVPYHLAVEFFVYYISKGAEIKTPLTGPPFQPLSEIPVNAVVHFEFLRNALEDVHKLQGLTNSPLLLLLRHSPKLQGDMLCVLLKSMV